MSLPPIKSLHNLPENVQCEVLTQLFEKCPTLETLILGIISQGNYSSYEELIDLIHNKLQHLLSSNQNDSRVYDIIAAHPRLGAKKADITSSHSASEQASLQQQSEEEAKQLKDLNDLYEKTFPGLRYVVFVNGRPRSEIMENMKMRIDRNDASLEKYEAFNAMCKIAIDRAKKLGRN